MKTIKQLTKIATTVFMCALIACTCSFALPKTAQAKQRNYELSTEIAASLATCSDSDYVSTNRWGISEASAAEITLAKKELKQYSLVKYNKVIWDTDREIPLFNRLWGNTALSTMKSIINEGWDSTDWAIIARVDDYHDALAASGLAGILDCPIMLTNKDNLNTYANKSNKTTQNLLKSKNVKNVLIVGGIEAVSTKVENQLRSLNLNVERAAGTTAAKTAIAIYDWAIDKGYTWSTDAIVATSVSYQDALSISPYAYAKKAPIFLTDTKSTKLGKKATVIINSTKKNPNFTENEQYVYDYLSARGYSNVAIAAIMGNIQQESGWSTDDTRSAGYYGGLGIFQLTDNRAKAMSEFATTNNIELCSVEAGIRYVVEEELENPNGRGYQLYNYYNQQLKKNWTGTKNWDGTILGQDDEIEVLDEAQSYKGDLDKFKTASDIAAAVFSFAASVERCDTGIYGYFDKRVEYAKEYLDKITVEEPTFNRAIICGGTAAVSTSSENSLTTATKTRLGAGTGYSTSKKIAEFCVAEGMQVKHMGVASARKNHYQDALCGGAFCGKNNAVLLLSDEGKWSSTGQLKSKYATQFINAHIEELPKLEAANKDIKKYVPQYISYDDYAVYTDSVAAENKAKVSYIFGGTSAIGSSAITGIGNWDEKTQTITNVCSSFCSGGCDYLCITNTGNVSLLMNTEYNSVYELSTTLKSHKKSHIGNWYTTENEIIQNITIDMIKHHS